MKLISAILIVIIALSSGCASIPQKAWGPVVETPYEYANYQTKEGPFVSVPLYVGAIVGSPTALITTPIGFLCESEGGEAQIGRDMAFFLLGPITVGDIVATPFLVLKKTFWDFPVWIVSEGEKEGMSNKANP